MSEGFKIWLSQELHTRQLSQRALARQSGISQAFISQVLSGDLPPSADFCIKVALALDVPYDMLLRLAGILPPAPPAAPADDATLQELIELARNLPPEDRQQILDYVRFIYQQRRQG